MRREIKWGLLVALLIPCWVIALKYDIDLVVLHYAAELTHSDLSRVYAYNGNLGRYFYGPTSLVLIWPLGALSYPVAKAVWIGLQTISFVVFWKMLGRLYPWLLERTATWSWIAIFIVSINPIHNNHQSNNIQLMLMAALILGEVLRRRQTPSGEIAAGILAVVAASVKVFPAYICLFYFLLFRKHLTLGIGLGAALCVLAPFGFFGLTNGEMLWRDFFSNLFTYEAENSLVKVVDILCLPSLLARWIGEGPGANLITKSIVGLVAGSCLTFCWLHRKASQENSTHLWALALFTMAFVNPSTRPHYFIFFVPAYASWLQLARGKADYALITLSVLLVAFTAEGVTGKSLNNWLEAVSAPTYGMILLGVGLVVALRGALRENSRSTRSQLSATAATA